MRARLASYLTPKDDIPRRVYLSTSALIEVSIFVLWCVLAYGGVVHQDFLAPPHAVLVAAYETLAEGSLIRHT
jgi:ABC-type nitrate/sulfonate/bicarbonate transport system permease component